MSKQIIGKLQPLFGSKSVKTMIFTSRKDKLFTFQRRERPRKSLGKIPAGSTDGEIVSTRPKRKKSEDATPQSWTRSRVGASLLLRWVGEQSGISGNLLSCIDEGSAKKLDLIAQFWLANQGDRLQRM